MILCWLLCLVLYGQDGRFHNYLVGEQFNAHEALRLGLINKITTIEDLDKTVDVLAQRLSSMSPIALRLIKLAINEGIEMELDRALSYEPEYLESVLSSEDAKAGIKAFLDSRKH